MQDIRSSNPPVVTGICDPNNYQAWHHCGINMCVSCFEIGINVIVKHVKSIGIIRNFCLPGGTCQDFECLGGQKKLLGCGLLGGISTQTDTMPWFWTGSKRCLKSWQNWELMS